MTMMKQWSLVLAASLAVAGCGDDTGGGGGAGGGGSEASTGTDGSGGSADQATSAEGVTTSTTSTTSGGGSESTQEAVDAYCNEVCDCAGAECTAADRAGCIEDGNASVFPGCEEAFVTYFDCVSAAFDCSTTLDDAAAACTAEQEAYVACADG